ncbi:MAG TPA: S8 family serine peptidase [Sphingomicrobium sp.]|nr:S8 family serine peptidase [Sphingomicrobium sp.]
MMLALLLAALAGIAAPASAAESVQADGEDRQILVMLTMAAPHHRPNSGYGGNYGDISSRAARKRLAQNIANRYGIQLREGWPMPVLGVDCYVMAVPAGKSIDKVIEAVSKERGVAWSQRMYSYAIGAAAGGGGGDPLYLIQPTAAEWKLSELHRSATGRGVKIAIVDSQVDVKHPDLAGQFIADRNFLETPAARPERHGTHVAGIIGAKAGNGIGIAGVAPGARLMALRACEEIRSGRASGQTLCKSLPLAKALQFAIDRDADVINLSLSGPRDLLLNKLLDVALSRNVTVVTAFDRSLPGGGFPASMEGVIPVADESLQRMPDGVYGAPGRDLPTTQPGGGWSLVNGTSYAVAQVSGLAALAGEKGKGRFGARLVRASDGKVQACLTIIGKSPRCR